MFDLNKYIQAVIEKERKEAELLAVMKCIEICAEASNLQDARTRIRHVFKLVCLSM
jgi:hypothetical protein